MKTREITNEEKRKSLYTYWNDLPFRKNVDSSKYFILTQSEVKNFIIKYIRDGIEDDFGKLHNLSRRHGFTAKELHDAFEKNSSSKKYSLSNFHFHIKTLAEEGYIMEITKILKGRHYRSFYGRTAITFGTLYDDNMSSRMSQNIFDPMKIMIKEMNPEMQSDHISQLLDENLGYLQDYYFRIGSWLKSKYPILYQSKMDLQDFVEFLAHFTIVHEKLSDSMKRIGPLLDLDQIMDYKRYDVENEETK